MRSWKNQKLRNELDRLFSFLNKNYNINWGGCCWLTYCLAINLERLGIPYSLVIYDDECTSAEEAFNNIMNRNVLFPTGDETACHYTLKVKGLGVLNKDNGSCVVIKGVTSEDIRWIYEEGDWNECYNKRLNNEIKDLVNVVFKIYEKEIC